MPQENVELVKRSLDKFNRGELESLLQDADPEIEWHDLGGTVHRGAEATAKHLRSALRDRPGYRVEAEKLDDAGGSVLVAGRGSAPGAFVGNPFFAVYAIHAGRIRSVRIFGTRDEAVAALEPHGSRARLERWFSSLSRAAKTFVSVVIGLGATATAIGAIVALWPDPPAELGAELSNVTRDPNVTLEQFAARNGTETIWAPSRPGTIRFASAVAQSDIDGTTPESGTTGPNGAGSIISQVSLTDEARASLQDGVREALSDDAVPPLAVGDRCLANLADPTCGLNSIMIYIGAVTDDGEPTEINAATVAQRLVGLFAGTRTQAVPDQGEPQPVGVTVNFDVTLTGFRGRRADVRWSLYRAGDGGEVPQDWLSSQPALWLEAEAQKDSASSQFWVPLPQTPGPYFVRIAVHDEDGDRLDYEDTPSVR